MTAKLIELQIFHLNDDAESVVVAALLADGTVGYGQGMARPDNGNEIQHSIFAIKTIIADHLKNTEPKSITRVFQKVYDLPYRSDNGTLIHTARCAVELALLDAYGKYFKNDLTSLVDWLGCGLLTANSGSLDIIKPSCILNGTETEILKKIKWQKRWGINDFKLNFCPNYMRILLNINRHFRKYLRTGAITLRFDAAGQWDIDTALIMCKKMDRLGVCSIEQPLASNDYDHWSALSNLTAMILTADESLVTLADAEYFAKHQLADCFDIKISQAGGLLPAIRMAELAANYDLDIQLGQCPGQSGILAAAGLKFLQQIPDVVFSETGSTRPENDIAYHKNISIFKKYIANKGFGLGIVVQPAKIKKIIAGQIHKVSFA